ncbi:hypothetical protein B0G80_4425 [Paraburkholderia sp. BL6669N2]|uniref:hypothetical protein n=1 Tax=Paraburkholderia sp. BL6669N2 TaxID=1938807 RepID=UPI000E3668CB|nr:hypothetical protein [Paraburkholderia sp. BL6669N2]REG61572.1 hypothetical protein B0G80_4425 [Paraburkholderia sp. BL6669N2]
MSQTVIDFAKLEGPVFTGRPRGEQLRTKLGVDALDESDQVVEVKIPDTTYSVSSSFVLGLFGKSVVHAGSKQAFYEKFHFQTSQLFRDVVDTCVTRALQNKTLFDH